MNLINNSKPFDLAFTIRDDIIEELMNSYNTDLFAIYWHMSLKMTLSFIYEEPTKNDLLSDEYLEILEKDNISILNIYFNAMFDRATMLYKYIDKIIDDDNLYPIIFSDTAINRGVNINSSRTLLLKLGYLDIVFCKNNIDKLRGVNPNMIYRVEKLYTFYNDEVDYFSSLQDLSENARLEQLNYHIVFFKDIKKHLDITKYYHDLDSPFFLDFNY